MAHGSGSTTPQRWLFQLSPLGYSLIVRDKSVESHMLRSRGLTTKLEPEVLSMPDEEHLREGNWGFRDFGLGCLAVSLRGEAVAVIKTN